MSISSYKDLDIWKKAIDLAQQTYLNTKKFPKEELFSLVSQMRRAAISIMANIAEGFGRNSNTDFRRFLGFARGSLLELESYIELSRRLEYFSGTEALSLFEYTDHIGRMMTRFVKNMNE